MRVYVDSSFRNFTFIEQDEPIYQGENKTSSILVYFTFDLRSTEYPTISFVLPNGREVGTLTMIRRVSDDSNYAIMYEYKFCQSDLLIPGVMHCTLRINTLAGYADTTIKDINVVGTFDAKVMRALSGSDYDIITKEENDQGEVITSFKSELESMRDNVNELRNGVVIATISDSDLETLFNDEN